MKIAVIAPTYLPARRANTVQVMKMCQAFCDLGHDIHLAVPTERADPALEDSLLVPSWDELRSHYGLHCSFPIEWLASRPELRRYDFGWRSIRWARRIQAELIYTRLPQAAALASLSGLPTILEVHDMPAGQAGPWLLRRFLAGRGARRLVVITRALSDDLKHTYPILSSPGFLTIEPDGVDLARYQNLPEPPSARKSSHPAAYAPGLAGEIYSRLHRSPLLGARRRAAARDSRTGKGHTFSRGRRRASRGGTCAAHGEGQRSAQPGADWFYSQRRSTPIPGGLRSPFDALPNSSSGLIRWQYRSLPQPHETV